MGQGMGEPKVLVGPRDRWGEVVGIAGLRLLGGSEGSVIIRTLGADKQLSEVLVGNVTGKPTGMGSHTRTLALSCALPIPLSTGTG